MNTAATGLRAAAALAVLSFVLPLGLALSVPLRPQGGDTVPGKVGMHVLQCERSFDLAGAGWLRERTLAGKRPYYAVVTADRSRLVSIWGPGPAVWGALTSLPLDPGLVVDDATLARRARRSAAFAVALASLFLFLAIAQRAHPVVALVGATTAALSFGGAGLLGQALWQQTVACVVFAASWLALGRGTKESTSVLWLSAGVALSLAAGLLRPADGVLAIAGLAMCLRPLLQKRHLMGIAIAAVLGTFVLGVFVAWNLRQFGTPWPAGQSITHSGSDGLFRSDFGDMILAFSALLLSPSRGLLVFAPIVVVAIATGARSSTEAKALSASILVQLAVYAAFHKWWGGVAFGPRLAAIPVWASCFVLFGLVAPTSISKRLVALAATVTIVIGLIGLYGYDPRKWDLRVNVDQHPGAVWAIGDSVLPSSLRALPEGSPEIVDSPEGPFAYCVDRTFGQRLTGNLTATPTSEGPKQFAGMLKMPRVSEIPSKSSLNVTSLASGAALDVAVTGSSSIR